MFTSATILFGILGLHDRAGAVMVAVFFGLSTGACKSSYRLLEVHTVSGAVVLFISDYDPPIITDVSLIPSLLAMMCKEPTELGYVACFYRHVIRKLTTYLYFSFVSWASVRMGFAFSLVAVANLIGNPIAGELLGKSTHDDKSLTWWKALVFAGVSLLFFLTLIVTRNR